MSRKTLDFSNDKDYEAILQDFGGIALLQEKYPHILAMLENTREMKKKGILDRKDCRDSTEYYDPIMVKKYPGICRVLEVPVSLNDSEEKNKNGLFVKSEMGLTEDYQMLIMVSKTWDSVTGKIFSAYAEYKENVRSMEPEPKKIKLSTLDYSGHLNMVTETKFYCIKNVQNKFVIKCNPEVHTVEMDLEPDRAWPLIENIKVCQPKERDGYPCILIIYNDKENLGIDGKPCNKNAAYSFPYAKLRKLDNRDFVRVYYPFFIEVQLADKGALYTFEENPISFDDLEVTLKCENMDNGFVRCGVINREKIKCELINEYTLRLDFQYDYKNKGAGNNWWVEIPSNRLLLTNKYHFYINFNLNIKKRSGKKIKSRVTVTSEALPESEYVKIIKPTYLFAYGCSIGEASVIRTQEGDKKISELVAGDMIYTEKGYKKLVHIVTGTKSEMIAVHAEGMEKLLLTSNHPVATERGIVEAGNLVPEDRVRVADKGYRNIATPEKVKYDGTVYSLILEESDMVFANGIMAGDYATVSDENKTVELKSNLEPMDFRLRDELIRWLNEKNNCVENL